MPIDQGLLKGTQSREWVVAMPPTGVTRVYTRRDESGLGPINAALTTISAPPFRYQVVRESIGSILTWVQSKETATPEIQRPSVWGMASDPKLLKIAQELSVRFKIAALGGVFHAFT